MPILTKEANLYPEILFEEAFLDGTYRDELPDEDDLYKDDLGGNFREASECCWWALYTKSRQEKSLSRELFGFQIPFYLPLVKKTKVVRGRKTSSFVPLFSGYLFLYGNEEDRTRSLMTNRVSRVLAVSDPDQLVHDLRQFSRLIDADVPLTVESRLSPGNKVRVKNGPFAGIEGTVLARRGRMKLLVSIDFLQQGASVEVDDFALEPID